MILIKPAQSLALAILLASGVPLSQAQQPSASNGSEIDSSTELAEITEEGAVTLLLAILKERQLPDLECLAFAAESDSPAGSKAPVWVITAREIHNAKCGGDPSVSPVRDRYRVSSTGEITVYDVINDEYTPL